MTGFVGTRDRSWGVRPIGARDAQAPAAPVAPQFFWLWSPCCFADGDLFYHTNDDELGRPWNRRALWLPLDAAHDGEQAFDNAAASLRWRPGTRHAAGAMVGFTGGKGGTMTFRPISDFLMAGLGYGHPKWTHGINHGELVVEREDWMRAKLSPALPQHFHVQALSDVRWTDATGFERRGRGVLEQLALGAHAPSGFTGLMDVAE